MSISSSPFLLLKDYLYKYISGTEGVRRDAFSYKWRGTEHCSRTQSADVDIQVSLSPHHPSCTTQGAASIKHKESLVRNKHTQPTTGTGTPQSRQRRDELTVSICSSPVLLQEKIQNKSFLTCFEK